MITDQVTMFGWKQGDVKLAAVVKWSPATNTWDCNVVAEEGTIKRELPKYKLSCLTEWQALDHAKDLRKQTLGLEKI